MKITVDIHKYQNIYLLCYKFIAKKILSNIAQSVGSVEYTNCISAEG